MLGMMLNLLKVIIGISLICYALFLIIFKKKEAAFTDIFFKIPSQYGVLWVSRQPDIYFRKEYIKYIFIPLYTCLISVVLFVLIGIVSLFI